MVLCDVPCCRQPSYEQRSSPVYSRYDNDQSHSRVSSSHADASQFSGDRDGRVTEVRRRSVERERRRSRSTERRVRPDDYRGSSSHRRPEERDRDRSNRPSDRRHGSRRTPDRHLHRDRERSRHSNHERRSHRSRSTEHRHSHSQSRHSSHSRKNREDQSARDRRSPITDTHQSRLPKLDDPFQQDLQKELDRVGKSKSLEQQNGSRD